MRLSRIMSWTASTALAIAAVSTLALEAKAQDRSLWLNNGGSAQESGVFLAGESIYGSCDSDCTDLDLFLYDSAGTLVDSDTMLDAVPVVTAPSGGTYTIEVTMPSCTHSAGCAVELRSDHGF